MLYHIFKYFTNCDLITYLRYENCKVPIHKIKVKIKPKLFKGFTWKIYIEEIYGFSYPEIKILAKGYSKTELNVHNTIDEIIKEYFVDNIKNI